MAALFRRAVLLECPIDMSLRESGEDVDLCRRLIENKQKLGVSGAVAYHYHRREFSAFAKQRFRNGLGTARLGFKYRETRIFINPLLSAISMIVRNMLTKRVTLVPYWFAGGLAQFLGVLVGLSRVRRSLVNLPTFQASTPRDPCAAHRGPHEMLRFSYRKYWPRCARRKDTSEGADPH